MHIVEFDESEFDLKQQQQQPVHSTDTWHNLSGTCSDWSSSKIVLKTKFKREKWTPT